MSRTAPSLRRAKQVQSRNITSAFSCMYLVTGDVPRAMRPLSTFRIVQVLVK
jgi:hypothetical protein